MEGTQMSCFETGIVPKGSCSIPDVIEYRMYDFVTGRIKVTADFFLCPTAEKVKFLLFHPEEIKAKVVSLLDDETWFPFFEKVIAKPTGLVVDRRRAIISSKRTGNPVFPLRPEYTPELISDGWFHSIELLKAIPQVVRIQCEIPGPFWEGEDHNSTIIRGSRRHLDFLEQRLFFEAKESLVNFRQHHWQPAEFYHLVVEYSDRTCPIVTSHSSDLNTTLKSPKEGVCQFDGRLIAYYWSDQAFIEHAHAQGIYLELGHV
ncbi:MAG: hypothetical protein WAP74_00930 [Patescibacteria group bacterium]